MALAELPVPQSSADAMCPPQARTTSQPLEGAAPERLKVMLTVVMHTPPPDVTSWLTYCTELLGMVAPAAVGAKRSKVPGICVGVVLSPEAPLQVLSAARLAPGIGAVAAGVGAVPGAVHPLPEPEPRMSTQGLLSLRFSGPAVGLVV